LPLQACYICHWLIQSLFSVISEILSGCLKLRNELSIKKQCDASRCDLGGQGLITATIFSR
jgi:hypothetical protein